MFLPAIASPFFLDDYLHASMAEGTFPAKRSAFDFYNFVDDGDRAALVERGLVPWWASPNLTIRFFRPLSSALLYLDHKVFGHAPLPMHLHSLVWWVLAVVIARRHFRACFSPRVAGIATVVFALAPCHAMPLAWLANREALVSIVFGLLALGAYTKWRDGHAVKHALVATLFFALAMLGGGEYALSFGGYVLAFEIVRRGDSIVRRLIGLSPFALPALVYLGVRSALRYGAAGSGFYSDPLREPLVFLRKAPWRAIALTMESWWTYDAAPWGASPSWIKLAIAAIVIASAVAVGIVVRRIVRTLEDGPRRTATWMITGSLISLTPLLAVVPAMRLVGVAAFGVAIATGLVLDHVWFPASGTKKSELASLVAIGLGFAQLVHGPFSGFLWARQHRRDAIVFAERTAWLEKRVGDVPNARIGVLRGMATSFFTPFALHRDGIPPARWTLLAHAGHVLVLRQDERTLELVSSEQRSLFPTGDGNLFRSEDRPLRVGETIKVPGLRATVIGVGVAGPRDVKIQLDDDPGTLVWVTDGFEGWKDAELPRPGFGAPFDP